jgi:hypothetical protein
MNRRRRGAAALLDEEDADPPEEAPLPPIDVLELAPGGRRTPTTSRDEK